MRSPLVHRSWQGFLIVLVLVLERIGSRKPLSCGESKIIRDLGKRPFQAQVAAVKFPFRERLGIQRLPAANHQSLLSNHFSLKPEPLRPALLTLISYNTTTLV
jgi:hypothetical protein